MYNIRMRKKSKEHSETLKQIKTIVNDPTYAIAEEDKSFIFRIN